MAHTPSRLIRIAIVAATAVLVFGGSRPVGSDLDQQSSVDGDASVAVAELEDARVRLEERDLEAAETAARGLLPMVERELGPDSLEVAEVLDILVEALWRSGRAYEPDARPNAERAVAIKEALLGPQDPATAVSLRNLAIVAQNDGDLDLAEALHRRIIAIQEQTVGPRHPQTALALRSLGNVFLISGRYDEAERLYRQALSIQEASSETEDRDLAITLNNLGNLLGRTGHYKQARTMYEQALAIKTAAPEADPLDVAWSLNGLAILHEDMGNYVEAQDLYLRTLEMRRRVLGDKHIQVAQSLDNLANLYRHEGDYQQAKVLTEEALAIGTEVLGPDDLFLAVVRDNLAELLFLTGDLGRATTLRRQTVEKRRQAQGADHPDYAWNLVGLADLYAATDDRLQAEQLYREGLAIQESQLGSVHPAVALTSFKLAELMYDAGRFEEAEGWVDRALTIRRETLGPGHPLVGQAMSRAALIEAQIGSEAEALEASLEAERIGRDHLRLTARVLPERQVFRYAEVRSSGLDLGLSLLERQLDREPVERVWDSLIRSRALVLDEMALRNQAISRVEEANVAELALEVAEARQYLASTLLKGGEGQSESDYHNQLAAAQRRKDDAERLLAAASSRFRRQQEQLRTGLEAVGESLPESSALVAYVIYDRLDLRGSVGGSRPAYFAFVLPGRGRQPIAVPLPSAELIDSLVARWTVEIGRPPSVAGGSTAASDSDPSRSSEQVAREVGEAIEQAIWAPVEPHLEGASRIFVVPDGALNLVSFAALPVGTDRYLVEGGPAIHYLSAERDLVVPPLSSPTGTGLLALGGALFDSEPDKRPRASELSPATEAPATRGGASDCGDFTTVRFEPLPASLPEIDEVIALWSAAPRGAAGSQEVQTSTQSRSPVVRLIGAAANETAFKNNAAGKQVIHLATHGFFLGQSCRPAASRTRGIGGVASASAVGPNVWAEANPLLLSGLALAGANRRFEEMGNSEDGILTAEEVASLELGGVEWAVLSACDTGVGEVTAGEGVLGLRRSFQVAGARTVIMSLWSVEDRAAAEWMSELYRGRFGDRLSTIEAVHQASLGVLTRRRAGNESTHPFYWAGFVAAGDWR